MLSSPAQLEEEPLNSPSHRQQSEPMIPHSEMAVSKHLAWYKWQYLTRAQIWVVNWGPSVAFKAE